MAKAGGRRRGSRAAATVALAALLVGAAGCEPGGGDSALPSLDGAEADMVAFHDGEAGDGIHDGTLQDVSPRDLAAPEVQGDTLADPGPTPDAEPSDTAAQDAQPADGSTTDEQGGDDAGPPPSPTGVLGGGVLLAEVDSPQLNLAVAGARFTPPEPPPAGTQVGPCLVGFSDPSAPVPPLYGFDAGVITVPATSPPVTLTPKSEGAAGTGYTSNLPSNQQDLLPGGGGLVQIQAAGGADLGAFAITLQAPEQVTVFQPTLGFGAATSTAFDVTVTWNGATGPGAGQRVIVNVAPLDGNYHVAAGVAATCEVAGDPGVLVIPSAVLTEVRGSAGSLNVALGVTRTREATAAAGEATVRASITRSSGGLLQLTP